MVIGSIDIPECHELSLISSIRDEDASFKGTSSVIKNLLSPNANFRMLVFRWTFSAGRFFIRWKVFWNDKFDLNLAKGKWCFRKIAGVRGRELHMMPTLNSTILLVVNYNSRETYRVQFIHDCLCETQVPGKIRGFRGSNAEIKTQDTGHAGPESKFSCANATLVPALHWRSELTETQSWIEHRLRSSSSVAVVIARSQTLADQEYKNRWSPRMYLLCSLCPDFPQDISERRRSWTNYFRF